MSGVGSMYPWQTDPSGFLLSILGHKPNITSTLRSPAQNEAVGGVGNSEHLGLNGQRAIDFTGTPQDATAIAQSGVPFDQLINEGNHIHVGFNPQGERNQTFAMNGGQAPPQVMQGQMQGGQGTPQAAPANDPELSFVDAALSHSQGAPAAPSADPETAFVDAALAHHGNMSTPKPPAPVKNGQVPLLDPSQSPTRDILSAIPTGIAKGVAGMAGLPGTLADLGAEGISGAANYFSPGLGTKLQNMYNAGAPAMHNVVPSSGQLISELGSTDLGPLHVPTTDPGKYAETISELVPFAGGGAGVSQQLGRLLTRAILPGSASEFAGEAGPGLGIPEGPARLAGMAVGGLPAGLGVTSRKLGSLLTSELDPESASLVSKYEALGGNLRPGQYNPSSFMRAGDTRLADLPTRGMAGFNATSPTSITPEAQANQYNGLLAKTFGENSTRVTGDVLEKAQDRIGNTIGNAVQGTTLQSTEPITAGLVGLAQKLDDVRDALDPVDIKRIDSTINSVGTKIDKGMPGTVYQAMRQRGGLLDGLSNDSNPTVASFGTGIRNILDQGFQDQAPPDDAAAILNARNQYRALKTIEPLAAKAPTGDLSGMGTTLLNRVASEYGHPDNAGDLGTIARVGAKFIKPAPSSGTAENAFWVNLLAGHPEKALSAMVGKAITIPLVGGGGRIVNSAINSPAARQKALGALLQQGQAGGAP